MVFLKKINDLTITFPKLKGGSKEKPNKMFNDAYTNVFFCSKKKSGKTNAIYNSLRYLTDVYLKRKKRVHIVVFCSSILKDDMWKEIVDHFKEMAKDNKKLTFDAYMSLYKDGENILKQILEEIAIDEDEVAKDEPQKPPKIKLIKCESDSESDSDDEPEGYNSKDVFIFVFDDLSAELKDKYVTYLMKRNRHFLANVLISSQYPKDLDMQARQQIDVWNLFRNLPLDKLEFIYKEMDLSIPFSLFYEMYRAVNPNTGQFNFLYVDRTREQFRKNYDQMIEY